MAPSRALCNPPSANDIQDCSKCPLEDRNRSTNTRIAAGHDSVLALKLAGGLVLGAIGHDIVEGGRVKGPLLSWEILLRLAGDGRRDVPRSVLLWDGRGGRHFDNCFCVVCWKR